LERWLVAKQGLIEAKFSEASRYTPRGLNQLRGQQISTGNRDAAPRSGGNPRHELRQQFDQAVRDLIPT